MDLIRLRQQLERHEGRRRKVYTDTTGHLSVGVGRNLTDVGVFDDEIDLMLDNDIARTMGAIRSRLPWVDTLDEVRQRAVVDFVFNVGIGTALTFHKTLAALRTGDFDTAASQLLKSRYAQQVGRRAITLSEMFRTGTDL